MSFKDFWKKLNNFSLAKRFFPDYIIDKNIFRFALVISILLLIALLSNYGFDLVSWYVLKNWLDTREKMLALFQKESVGSYHQK